ncbi:hypothetical protein SD70_14760 [Gordoniibacillus kamchatkensis]|uniref:Response regulatory domain-containing protein n=1 Tax=Gordoniibacillus kamchatkensis TaxID=1590651 RepID=A0ABR5AGQ3_9BACL|nr:response regulator [Paenibacillus sp. VKM B-2647]KIL40228.1 hypothetical protein SD70_14760 [Paenibacillus sp. VKM B-2647]
MNDYNIMILDDEEAVTALLKTNLELAGLNRIDIFTDPVQAIAMFRNKKYHILLTDMDMPEMDGIDVLKKVKQYDPMTQVIMTTEKSTIDKTLACLELGANDYVLKPFKSVEYILEVVEYSIKKLERWKEAIKGTVLKQNEASALPKKLERIR